MEKHVIGQSNLWMNFLLSIKQDLIQWANYQKQTTYVLKRNCQKNPIHFYQQTIDQIKLNNISLINSNLHG